ncbi:DUF4402 domain-containing protein [Sphingorhabdus sp. Alg239-R122]|uniref:DUF4402 domain-containing protein n=1 Tax=Sphingorhabdus sp. Alg239-R122 TaxID=2305989 RepID=UPI0013DCC76A|nr:DUF4402 domain-containing protein [Sphingorhabdus sp. Alg239-R122]
MFNKAKFLTAGSAVLAAALVSTSANAATANADARATILEQITVTKTSDLDFGTVVVGATGGNVALSSADGSVSCDAALVCSGTTTAAAFDVTGTAGETVDITVDPSVNLVSGGNSMTASLSGSDASLVLAGGDSFTVGGTLAVAANQAAGDYVGNFDVTVEYQ